MPLHANHTVENLMETIWQDTRYALRSFSRKPAFALIVVLTLALGIGANAGVFSFVNALLLTSPPYKDPDRLVRLMSRRGTETGKLSVREVYDLKEQARLFEDFASLRDTQYNITGDGPPEALIASVNTYNLFSLLGVKPVIGDTWPQSHEGQRVFAIVIGYDVWQNRFGGDPNIVGKNITLDTAPYTVLGVMPPGFNFPLNAQLYRRVPPGDIESRAIREASVIARLKPGVTIAQAQGELDALAVRWEQSYPATNTGLRLAVSPFREQYIGGAGAYLWLLTGAVGFVLLMACVNVVNLMLARALAREKEMAIRAALGAGRVRLLRQMLTESLCLTLPGGLLGLALSVVTVKLLTSLLQFDLPPWMKIAVDGRVLLFTLAVSLLVGLLTGLLPALQASKPELNESLKDGAKGASGGNGSPRVRRVLVIAQVALALTLLAGAALMMTSLLRLRQTPLGFDGQRLLTMKIDLPWAKYKEIAQIAPFYKRVIEEVERLPGVEAAAFNDSLPLAGQDVREGANKLTVEIEGQAHDEQARNPFVNAQIVSPGYFSALKIPLVQGRFFDQRDQEQTPAAALISERLAARFWPGQNPIGKRLKLGGRGQNFQPGNNQQAAPWLTVAGVVGDVRQRGVASEAGLDVYVCDQQTYAPESYLAVRAAVDPLTLTQQVKQAIWRADPEQSAFDVQTMEQRILQAIWQQRLTGFIFTLFAALALTLAAVGIYGVMSYLVSQRTHEMGLRMALGAQPRDVLKLVVGQGMKLVLIGVVIGVATALVIARVMNSLLFGVTATDPLTFASVSLLLTAVALLACYIPARRAAKVDPMIALRSQ